MLSTKNPPHSTRSILENEESCKKDFGTNCQVLASGAEVELQKADVQTQNLKELTNDQLDAIVSAINGCAELGEVIDQLESFVPAVGENSECRDQKTVRNNS